MPFTPPLALISEIAINVASASDFSIIDKPPVSENKTPTWIASAACADRRKKPGVAKAPAAPAAPVVFRNLRRSIVITPVSPVGANTFADVAAPFDVNTQITLASPATRQLESSSLAGVDPRQISVRRPTASR